MKSMKKFFHSLLALTMLFGAASCEEEIVYVEGTPVLSVSTDLFVADGEDEVELTVMVGDVDVTADAKLYVDYELMSSRFFTTTRAKEYKFFASYNGKVTKNIIVKAADPKLYNLEVPADSKEDKFGGFSHKVLITQATGTWCGYCPYMIRALEVFREQSANASKAIVVAAHNGDELSSVASEAIISSLRIGNFPSVYFNLNPEASFGSYGNLEIDSQNLDAATEYESKPSSNVGIAAIADANKTTVAVRTAVKVGADGAYRINAWLVEDGVTEYQSSYWSEFREGKIEHDFVLRAASCVSPIQGAQLGGKDSSKKGDVVELYHEFDVKEAGVVNTENCKVVVLVTSAVDSKFYVENVIECPVGQSVPFGYVD